MRELFALIALFVLVTHLDDVDRIITRAASGCPAPSTIPLAQ